MEGDELAETRDEGQRLLNRLAAPQVHLLHFYTKRKKGLESSSRSSFQCSLACTQCGMAKSVGVLTDLEDAVSGERFATDVLERRDEVLRVVLVMERH